LSVAAWPTAMALGAPSHVISPEYPKYSGEMTLETLRKEGAPGAVEEGSAKTVISMGGEGR
jgi:hypothetical protein